MDTTTTDTQEHAFTISRNHIRALLIVAASNDVRDYLNGICLEVQQGTARLIASDGHRLAVALVGPSEAPDMQVIIPRVLLAAVKVNRKCPEVLVTIARVGTKPRQITIAHSDDSVQTVGEIVGRFPDWKRVLPITCSGEVAQFNADYLGDFGKMGAILSIDKDRTPLVRIHHNGTGVAGVEFDCPDICAVIMPVRVKLCGWGAIRSTVCDNVAPAAAVESTADATVESQAVAA